MKFSFECPKCNPLIKPEVEIINGVKTLKLESVQFYNLHISNSNIIEFNCNKGHQNIIYLKNLKYEILFESGLAAYKDGYLGEAISSFYSSLESFYESLSFYFINILNPAINLSEYKNTKIKTSERKIGAFYSLYLVVMNEAPIQISNKVIETRNLVIHGSKYPTESETSSFGNSIKNYIVQILEKIESKFPDITQKIELLNQNDFDNRHRNYHFNLFLSSSNSEKKIDIKEYTPSWVLLKNKGFY